MQIDVFEHIKEFVRKQIPGIGCELSHETQLCSDLGLCGYREKKFLHDFVNYFGIVKRDNAVQELHDTDEMFGDMIEWIPASNSDMTLADLEKMLLKGSDQ